MVADFADHPAHRSVELLLETGVVFELDGAVVPEAPRPFGRREDIRRREQIAGEQPQLVRGDGVDRFGTSP